VTLQNTAQGTHPAVPQISSPQAALFAEPLSLELMEPLAMFRSTAQEVQLHVLLIHSCPAALFAELQ
jgi:hypothetical protein